MPKLSYGPAAKARTQQLLRSLVDYGNDELWAAEDAAIAEQERFAKALDGLRPHLSSHWQSKSNRALIIRTKIRHLVQLARLNQKGSPQPPGKFWGKKQYLYEELPSLPSADAEEILKRGRNL